MDEVITTIYFDGQFWSALVEKISPDGSVSVAKHVFGPEPTGRDMIRFYQEIYDTLTLRPTAGRVRLNHRRSREEQDRCFSKSLALHSAGREEYLREKKSRIREKRELSEREKYELKREKRKERRKH